LGDPESDYSGSDEAPKANAYASHPLTDVIVFGTWLEQKIYRVLSPELVDVRVNFISQ
jgi:hypothetical protein